MSQDTHQDSLDHPSVDPCGQERWEYVRDQEIARAVEGYRALLYSVESGTMDQLEVKDGMIYTNIFDSVKNLTTNYLMKRKSIRYGFPSVQAYREFLADLRKYRDSRKLPPAI